MKTLELLELVNLEEETVDTYGGEQKGYVMKLKDEFSWFKTDEFQKLWRLKVSYPDRQEAKQTKTQQASKPETLQSLLEEHKENQSGASRSTTRQEG